MIALSSKNEKRRFNLAYCEIKKAERAEVQRNRHYSPRSTAWASEGERSHASLRCIKRPPQKVFETRCRGAILHASLAENVLSGDKIVSAAAMGDFKERRKRYDRRPLVGHCQ